FSTVPSSTEIYTLSLHDALPIFSVLFYLLWTCKSSFLFCFVISSSACLRACWVTFPESMRASSRTRASGCKTFKSTLVLSSLIRSEEHTSELQSRENLVCRLLLE